MIRNADLTSSCTFSSKYWFYQGYHCSSLIKSRQLKIAAHCLMSIR